MLLILLAASTQVVTDPHTGQTKTKKKLGGAYPGQRRPQHQTYVPPADAFGKDGTATAHFIAYGGGNALTLVQQDGSHAPQVGKPQSEFIQGALAWDSFLNVVFEFAYCINTGSLTRVVVIVSGSSLVAFSPSPLFVACSHPP